jgi:Na+/alanine symporter
MALPNLIGLYILGNDVKKALNEYTKKLKDGELDAEAIRS